MRLRNIRGSKDVIASCPFVVQEPESCRGRWAEVFGNENPIHIEVGMGKGRFLMDMAVLHPEINYIGIEMYDSVLLRAVQKREKLETELKNLFFIRMDARQLPEVFAEGEVDNKDLFDFSLEEMKNAEGWELTAFTYDLHHDVVLSEGNVMTEYEEKFSSIGNPICKMEARFL